MEEAKVALKKMMKIALKAVRRLMMFFLLFIAPVLILLAAALYFITIDDGTYKEDDWSSTPYAAGEFANDVSVGTGGELNVGVSAIDLWDKIILSGGKVSDYLDTPEELARLMKAQIVTEYPDTRSNPDEEIDWNTIIENPDKLQGIVKFRRADPNGYLSTMKYVDSETFYNWIELYAQNGNETYKTNALTHFTLRQNINTNNRDTEANYTTSDIEVDYSNAIVNAAHQVASPGAGLCQAWVREVYNQAGLGNVYYGTAYEAFQNSCVSTSRDNIPIGAAVYGTGSGTFAGHVGIYIGGGMVMDNVGYIKTSTLEEWISWQEQKPTVIAGVEPGWLGWGWQAGSPTIIGEVDSITKKNSTANRSSYVAIVATWKQIDTTITTNDSSVETNVPTQYIMSPTSVDYQKMVEPYTMPFDLLWALLVVGEDKDFVFELADLVYRSDIQITIYDNLTVNTDIDEWHYKKQVKAIVNASITGNYKGSTDNGTVKDDVHDPHSKTSYVTTKTVVTQTNIVRPVLTRANVWIVDYINDYQYTLPIEKVKKDTVKKPDQEYPDSPNSTGNTYSCDHIDEVKEKIEASLKPTTTETESGAETEKQEGTGKQEDENSEAEDSSDSVTFSETITVKYYNKYVDISDNVTNETKTQSYISKVPKKREKIDPNAQEENFVTIFNKPEYATNKRNIKSADLWLFEILETNNSTANMVDLIKFLLLQATGKNYGVDSYDFSEYDASLYYGVTNIQGDTVKEKVWFTLKTAGYSEYAIAAVMGNIQHESGFDPNVIEGDTGIGFGLCQWSYGRRDNLEAYAASKGESAANIDIQIEFLIAELTPGGGANGYASYQLGGLSSSNYDGNCYQRKDWENSQDLDTATIAFMALFERPSYDPDKNHIDRRRNSAREYYNEFQGKEAPEDNNSN